MNKKIYEALHWASSYLTERERDANAGEMALMHVLQTNRAAMLARLHDRLSDAEWAQFQHMIEQHGAGVPIQHLIGSEMFYGRPFDVNQDVLIPRPETEELVYHALNKAKQLDAPLIADIGTGSGAIAVTMKLERPDAVVYAVDLSGDALQTAQKNAAQLQADVTFVQGDLLKSLTDRDLQFDIILSNPPYIPAEERSTLSTVVVDHEPHMALFGGEDGLDLYRRLAEQLPLVLKKGGFCGVETGAGQTKAVAALFQAAFPGGTIEIIDDINGKDRMVFVHV